MGLLANEVVCCMDPGIVSENVLGTELSTC
jgi:hypothetical protein